MSLVIHQEEAAPILSGPAELRELPEWFRDRQRAAWKQFESLPNPTRKDQAWRFSNVGLLDLAKFKVGGTLTEEERDAILERDRSLWQLQYLQPNDNSSRHVAPTTQLRHELRR